MTGTADEPNVTSPQKNGGRALVTGANGFIGRQVLEELCLAGGTPRALVRSGLERPEDVRGAEVVRGDLCSAKAALADVGAVFHFAYDIRASGPENILQFDAFLDALARTGTETLVHASSIVVHDGWPHETLAEDAPITPPDDGESYRGAKIAMERLVTDAVRRGNIRKAVILRPTLVYGRGGRMWTVDTVARLRSGTVLLPERPRNLAPDAAFGTCHLLHVGDLAAAAIRAAASAAEGVSVFNLCDPRPPTWEDYYRAHAAALGEGAIEMVDFEDLAAQVPEPFVSSGVSLAARASAIARRVVGHRRVDDVMRRLRSYAPARGPNIPDRFLFDLYASTGRVNVSKAEKSLGFRPEGTFRQHIDAMSDYLKTL